MSNTPTTTTGKTGSSDSAAHRNGLVMSAAFDLCRQINAAKSGWYAAAEPIQHTELNGYYRVMVRQLPQAVLESTQTIRNQDDWQRFHDKHLPTVPITALDVTGATNIGGASGGVMTNPQDTAERGHAVAGV